MLGAGSGELAATVALDAALSLDDYASVRLSRIGGLRDSAYRQMPDAASDASI